MAAPHNANLWAQFPVYQALQATRGYLHNWNPWMNHSHKDFNHQTYMAMNNSQRFVLYHLTMNFFNCLGIGEEDWTEDYVPFWNDLEPRDVFPLLIMAARQVVNQPTNTDSCWRTYQPQPGQIPNYCYVNVRREGKDHRVKVARLVCGMLHVPCLTNGDRTLQASHLCQRVPDCINPWHILPESDLVNKSRIACANSVAHYCPHTVKCIWTRSDGKLMPHRNDPSRVYLRHECDCEEWCFG
jgi:hypothetical protein